MTGEAGVGAGIVSVWAGNGRGVERAIGMSEEGAREIAYGNAVKLRGKRRKRSICVSSNSIRRREKSWQ
jgi:hypothetical protein